MPDEADEDQAELTMTPTTMPTGRWMTKTRPGIEPTIPLPTSTSRHARLHPAAGPQDLEAEVDDDEVRLTFGNRRYRIRGLSKNLAYDVLQGEHPRHQRHRPVRGHLRPVLGQAPQGLRRPGRRRTARRRDRRSRPTWAVCCSSWKNCRTSTSPRRYAAQGHDARHDRSTRRPTPCSCCVTRSCSTASSATSASSAKASNKLVGYLAAVSRKLDEPLGHHHPKHQCGRQDQR